MEMPGMMDWIMERRTKLLLFILVLMILAVIYAGFYPGESNKAEVWYQNHGQLTTWDDVDEVKQRSNYLTSDNLSGAVKHLPDGVTRFEVEVRINNDAVPTTDDVPLYLYPVHFAMVISGSKLRSDPGIGINYSSVSVNYAFVVFDNNTLIAGFGERGYSLHTEVVGDGEYGEWSKIDIKLSRGCMKVTLDGNMSKRICGDFGRASIGVENYRQDWTNLTVHAVEQDVITRSATVLGFDEITLPGLFVFLSFLVVVGLLFFLIVVLKDFELSNIMKKGGIVIFIWAIIFSLILFRVIII
jgi:hypothetical protein